MNPEKIHLYKKQYQQPIEEETPPHKENQRRLLPLIAENGLRTNTYTKKSSYTMVVTHLPGEDNVKFAGEWILHINPLIGIQRSSK